MIDEFDDLANRLDLSVERLEKLFEAAGIQDPSLNLSASLARLAYWMTQRVGPDVQSELHRRKELIVLERELSKLEDRHINAFGLMAVLPESIHISGKIYLLKESLRVHVPNDESYSAIRRLYSDLFFAAPPKLDPVQADDWINKVLVAITTRRPIKDGYGVEYVDSSKFQVSEVKE